MSTISFCPLKSYGSVNSIRTQLAHGEIVEDTKADLHQIVFPVLGCKRATQSQKTTQAVTVGALWLSKL